MRENAHRSRGVFHPSTLLASCSGSCCRRFFLGALAWTCPRAQTSYRRRANYTAASGILAGQAPCTLVYGGCGHLLYLAVGCLCGVALHVRAVHAPSGGLEEENHELPVGEAGGHVRTGRFRTSPSSAAISLSKSASSASRSAIATAGRGGKSLMIMFCFSSGPRDAERDHAAINGVDEGPVVGRERVRRLGKRRITRGARCQASSRAAAGGPRVG